MSDLAFAPSISSGSTFSLSMGWSQVRPSAKVAFWGGETIGGQVIVAKIASQTSEASDQPRDYRAELRAAYAPLTPSDLREDGPRVRQSMDEFHRLGTMRRPRLRLLRRER